MYVVDASVWVSWFIATEPFSRATTEWVNTNLRQGNLLYSPSLVLPEVAGALARRSNVPRLGREATSRLLEASHVKLFPLEIPLLRLSAHVAAEAKLRGADAIYVALALTLALPLITWDQEMIQRSQGLIESLTPLAAQGP